MTLMTEEIDRISSVTDMEIRLLAPGYGLLR